MRYTLALLSLCLFASACTKDNTPAVVPEVPVTKKVAFSVYAGQDYAGPFYDNANGLLTLTIARISNDGSTRVLWDTAFTWRKLAAYPSFQNKLTIDKEFSVLESKEKLHVSFVRTYNFNGAISRNATGEAAPQGTTSVSYTVEM